jgi:hypothetical protein
MMMMMSNQRGYPPSHPYPQHNFSNSPSSSSSSSSSYAFNNMSNHHLADTFSDNADSNSNVPDDSTLDHDSNFWMSQLFASLLQQIVFFLHLI